MARPLLLIAFTLQVLSAGVISEYTFDAPPPTGPTGWVTENRSDPAGANPMYFSGWVHSSALASAAPFQGRGGSDDTYMYSSFEAADGNEGSVISTWLVTPVINLRLASQLTFYTRTTTSAFPDRMRVLFRQANAISVLQEGNGGIGAVGDDEGLFTELLLDINPLLAQGGYPDSEWTPYTLNLPTASVLGDYGRVAFRFYVNDGYFAGNGIGVDDVSLSGVPEPATMVLIGIPLAVIGFLRRRKSPLTT